MNQKLRGIVGISALASMGFLLHGCDAGPSTAPTKETAKVSGKVLLDGNPLKGVHVLFDPKDGGGGSSGVTDEQGHYELEYSGGGLKGAVVGTHDVSFRDDGEEMIDGVPIPGGNEGRGQIPEKYIQGNSTITRDVASGENTFDFELDSE